MTARERRTTGRFRTFCGKAAAVGLACGILLGPIEAFAGACQDTKRNHTMTSISGLAAHTVVRNKAGSGSYDVIISRGGTEKSSGTIAPGAQVEKLSGVLGEGLFSISIKPAGEAEETACGYQIEVAGGDSWWRRNLDSGDVCDGNIKVTCSKSFHPSSLRLNTTFVITD
jgi:hypothetical protein